MTVNDNVTTQASPRGKAMTITLWVLQILLALMFGVASAAPKLFGEQNTVESFNDIGAGQWFRYLVGALELAGAIGLVIPRLAGLAALCLIGLMVGATYTQLFILDAPLLALTPVVLGALLTVIAWNRRSEIWSLFGRG